MSPLSPDLRQRIVLQANYRCEYCLTSQRVIGMPLVIDHIIPRSLGGSDEPENLCAACYRCNEYKGARTHAHDPITNEWVALFNPRVFAWREHFAWANGGTHIVGLTPIGRASAITLRLNNEYVVESRVLWIARGWHPPAE